METSGIDGARRGLFRRGRRSDEGSATSTHFDPDQHLAHDAVATVDDIARRIDALTAGSQAAADQPGSESFDMQRAIIARANDLAAANGATTSGAPAVSIPASPTSTNMMPSASEAPVQQPAPAPTTDDQATDDTEIQARLDAALEPIATPAPAQPVPVPQQSVTLEPTAAPTPAPRQVQDAELVPTGTAHAHVGQAAASIGIDVDRVMRLIEEEAAGIQQRMELELRGAQDAARQIIDRSESEAERIREHGQAQARVLLGEVEEIISEAQQTGEQILQRASEEASTLRSDSTSLLQQAQTEARAIVETARREGEQVLAEQRRLATVRAQEAMREQDRLKDQIRRLEERRRQVLESLEPLISQLTQMMPTGIDHNVVQLQRQQQQPQR